MVFATLRAKQQNATIGQIVVTWFANEIMARAVPSLVDEVAGLPGYIEAVHVVRNLDSHHFHDETVRHGLPPEGLLIVRPVGEPSELEDWYDERVIPWLAPSEWNLHELAVTPEAIARLVPAAADLPPADFLRALKGLAVRHHTTVTYASFSTWGGANELEYAWVLDEDESVLLNTTTDMVHLVLRAGHPPRKVDQDLLQALCMRLGLVLPTPYFAPHARSFDWHEHLVAPAVSAHRLKRSSV